MNKLSLFTKGLIFENPILVLAVGLCPVLAMTNRALYGLVLGLLTFIILMFTSLIASILKKLIPDEAATACHVIVIAGITNICYQIMFAHYPVITEDLGIFIALIGVNTLLLTDLDYFARYHSIVETTINSLGLGLGYLIVITLFAAIRELLGTGTLFGKQLLALEYQNQAFLSMLPGALLLLAFLMALMNFLIRKWKQNALRREAEKLR
ncbi:MAG: Rnf-Nqr domain containing protein [Anaerovoracaceae bacterium]